MIYPQRAVRVFFIMSLTMTGTGLSGCATQDKHAQATSGAKSSKLAHSAASKTAKAVLAKPSADGVRTASLSPSSADADAGLAGKTLIYRYGQSRGTILYHLDGTLAYDEPGVRSGTGKWQILDGRLCQSFSGISEPCQILRKSAGTYYAGPMTLVMAKP
jgi:outer membrane protein TolC